MDLSDLVKTLSDVLRMKQLRICCAESCTGGLVCSLITDLAGSSDIFDRGFVTYSNQSKIDLLGVSQAILNQFGAVSAECAAAMALGALKNSEADLALSITGIAGPSGGSAEKPVGLVYFGFARRQSEVVVAQINLPGERQDIRFAAARAALELVLNKIGE
ncbi:MAG: CinA family protein [Alphaproteobacteria bacterium]|nr:CinA family protein [Alphaproteobacteria bacterium]